nr:MAG TPA: KorB domain [Caudoviricetes sp.]
MDRAQEMKVAQALNEAIWLRDNCETISEEDLIKSVASLGGYELFSCRQLSAIVNGKLNHVFISKLINKSDRTGGKLNVGTLDILRSILYSRADSTTDFNLILQAVEEGTSQGMISKLTGVSQASISNRVRMENNV